MTTGWRSSSCASVSAAGPLIVYELGLSKRMSLTTKRSSFVTVVGPVITLPKLATAPLRLGMPFCHLLASDQFPLTVEFQRCALNCASGVIETLSYCER